MRERWPGTSDCLQQKDKVWVYEPYDNTILESIGRSCSEPLSPDYKSQREQSMCESGIQGRANVPRKYRKFNLLLFDRCNQKENFREVQHGRQTAQETLSPSAKETLSFSLFSTKKCSKHFFALFFFYTKGFTNFAVKNIIVIKK